MQRRLWELKNISTYIRMKKNPQTKEDTFWIFKYFHGIMRVQTPTCIPTRKFYQWSRWPRNLLYAATYSNTLHWLIFKTKAKTKTFILTENLLNFKVLRHLQSEKIWVVVMLCKINTCLQKTTTCIGLRAEQIFSVNI